MIFRERLGYREIARRQGIPEGTVKSRAWTCRRRLWELLEGEGPGAEGRRVIHLASRGWR